MLKAVFLFKHVFLVAIIAVCATLLAEILLDCVKQTAVTSLYPPILGYFAPPSPTLPGSLKSTLLVFCIY